MMSIRMRSDGVDENFSRELKKLIVYTIKEYNVPLNKISSTLYAYRDLIDAIQQLIPADKKPNETKWEDYDL